MYENDYVWLLKTLANTSVNINQLYGLKVRIPEIILLNSGDPKLWFYQEKEQVKMRSENLLKIHVVKEFFCNPQIIENPQSLDNEYMIRKSKSTLNFNDSNKPLFCVNIEIPSKEIKTIKKISKGVADELFSNFQDNADYCKQWTKIFSYIPSKSACLFDVCLSRENKDENYKLKIVKKDYSLKDIKVEDFAPPEGMNQRKELFPRDEKTGTDKFSSIASTINSVLDKTTKGVARFLESKTKLHIGELNLEVLVDSNYNTWIIGSKGISFYNKKGEIEKDTEKEGLVFPKTVLKHFFQCPGTYCNFAGETNFHQEGDEAINLYKKNRKHETFEIPFKSVILDIIEKCKQIDRLQKNLPEYSTKHILQYIETHPFEFRKYYSIGELLQSYLFKGYKVSNMYSNMRVCHNCHFIYEKIDGYRVQKVLKPENSKFNKEHAKSVIDKFFENNAPVSSRNERDKKEVFSQAFYEKLESFDKNILQILGLEKKVENMEDFFEMTSAHLRRLSPIPERRSEISIKSRSSIRPSVKFPTINKEIISDPANLVNRERLRMPANRMAEVIGYKHHLGHANNLRDSGAGYALSRSSIHLNRLHDKLNKLRLNTDYSADYMIENSSTKDGSESGSKAFTTTAESRNRIDLSAEVRRVPFRQRIKELDVERENRDSLFNVAVDKINFFSEEEKMELYEKENKIKEKEMEQKNFYAKNGLLAQSILGNPLFSKKTISTKNLLEVYSQNPDFMK